MALLDEVADRIATLPDEAERRPPRSTSIHTLYWPADRFGPGTLAGIGAAARAAWPDAGEVAWRLGWPVDEGLHAAVTKKLLREPVEDLRIDFEDGYGVRDDAEEDAAAVAAGEAARELPIRFGLRTKALTGPLVGRAVATLEAFATAVARPFVLTVPKVTTVAQVDLACALLQTLEGTLALAPGALQLEIMVEVPRQLFDEDGRLLLPGLVAAGGGRLVGVHLGVYDFTSAWGVPPAEQGMDHPACDFVRDLIKSAAAGSGLTLSAGSTNLLPRGDDVARAWRASAAQIEHVLRRGWYHGWDLHPGQLPIRFAANYRFYRDRVPAVLQRLRGEGAVLDDAPTIAGLREFVDRAVACGAVTKADVDLAPASSAK